MKKSKKTIILTILLIFGISTGGFSLSLEDIQDGVAGFSSNIAQSLPFNSTLGLNWSNAYIGKLFPSIPPHFGAGLSLGFTTFDSGVINSMAALFNESLPWDMDKLILPVYTAEARIGGLFLPFDVGFKVGYLPEIDLFGLDVNYLLVGADVRYAVMEGNIILPQISVGVGLNYLEGGIGVRGSNFTVDFDEGGGGSLTIANPRIGLEWSTYTLDLRAQISKSFIIITPYAGIGATYGWSTAGYNIRADISGDINEAGENYGIVITDAGMSSMVDNESLGFRAFGGLSVNLAILKIDLAGLYSFSDGNYGVSLGFRFQL